MSKSTLPADIFQVGKTLRDFGPHCLDRLTDRLDISAERVRRALKELRSAKQILSRRGVGRRHIYFWIE